jgi:3',5'-cyclic AMP phosphodiesterase CpdA
MPFVFHQPQHRRDFLKTTLLGGAAYLVAGRRPARADAESGSGFHLALLSDTHIPGNREDRYRGFSPVENLQRVVPQVLAAQPQGVLLCGDAARLEGKAEDYQELRTLLGPLATAAPVYIALGNHDDRTNFLGAFPTPPGEAAKVNGKHVTVLTHPHVRIVVLDSLLFVNKTPGLLGKAQRDWLAAHLPQMTDRPLVLFVHHTLNDSDGALLDADRLFALLEPHRHVKAIFYGHSHVWELGERSRIKLINLPAVGYNFADKEPVGWVDARFLPDGVTLTLRAIAGNQEQDGRATTVRWG